MVPVAESSVAALQALVSVEPGRPPLSPRAMLETHLPTLTPEQQLLQVLSILNHGKSTEEQAIELVAESWAYLKTHSLWRAGFESLAGFQMYHDPHQEWDHASQRHRLIVQRKERTIARIREAWGESPEELLPASMCPAWISDNLLRALRRLSLRTSLDAAIARLSQAIEARRHMPGRRKDEHLLVQDVERVLAGLSQDLVAPSTGHDNRSGSPQIRTVASEQGGRSPEPQPLLEKGNSGASSVSALSDPPSDLEDPYDQPMVPQRPAVQPRTHADIPPEASRQPPHMAEARPPALKRPAMYRQADRTVRGPRAIDHDDILRRFSSPRAPELWRDSGNLIIGGMFEHLNREDVKILIEQEFRMYRHHQMPSPDTTQEAWCRYMIHSLLQQLLRQDPLWYALIVATRPDHEWRLVTYPYVANPTQLGEADGFLHLDEEIEAYLQSGTGSSLVSSCLALEDEDGNACARIVPGLHDRLEQWYDAAQARKAGHVAGDEEDIRPCTVSSEAFGLRITHPAVLCGTSQPSSRTPRTVHGFYMGVDDDHEYLDGRPSLSWEGVAACHRDRLVPGSQPCGKPLNDAIPRRPFPATVLIRGVSPLCDALVGARKWTDPAVLIESATLLGPDARRSWDLVNEIRGKLVASYLAEIGRMVCLEARVYGPYSYFGLTPAAGGLEQLSVPAHVFEHGDEDDAEEEYDNDDGDDTRMSG